MDQADRGKSYLQLSPLLFTVVPQLYYNAIISTSDNLLSFKDPAQEKRDNHYVCKLQSEEGKVVTFQFPQTPIRSGGSCHTAVLYEKQPAGLFHIFPRAVNLVLSPIISIGKPSSFLVGRSIYTSISPSREA